MYKRQGTFQLLNSHKTGGEDPCYIITNGKNVVTANYSGGSISVFPIAKDGSLLPASNILKFEGSGVDKERQEKSHLHCIRTVSYTHLDVYKRQWYFHSFKYCKDSVSDKK